MFKVKHFPKMRIIWTLIIGYVLVVSSCHQSSRIDIYDGFESKELSEIWSDWRFLPGAVEMQSEVVRRGSSACRVTLRPGDQMEEERGTILERAELAEAIELVSHEGISYQYSFSVFLPNDFPIVNSRLVMAQWKQYSESMNFSVSNPVVALRYKSGVLRLTCQFEEDKINLYKQEVDLRNRWIDFSLRIRFTSENDGHIEAWMDEEKIVDYTGRTAYSEEYGYAAPNYFYFKMGIYRDHIPEPMTIYIDEYRKEQL